MTLLQRGAAIIAGIAGILLMPLVTTAFYNGGYSPNAPLWTRLIRDTLRPLSRSGSSGDLYQAFGRVFLLIFMLLLIAALGLRRAWSPLLDREGKRGFRLLIFGLILNIFGSIADYWLGYDVLRQPLWGLSFVIGTEIGSLIYLTGSIMIGRSVLRSRTISRAHGWLMILLPPLGVFLTFWGIQHIPGAFVFAIGLQWLIIALTLRSPAITDFTEPYPFTTEKPS